MTARTAAVLVVSQNPDMQVILSDRLQEAGYSAVAAHNSEEALGLMGTSLTCGILLDLDSTTIDGLNLLSEFQSRFSHLPVVVVSARRHLGRIALARGAMAYFRLPLDFAMLLLAVTRIFHPNLSSDSASSLRETGMMGTPSIPT